MVSSHAGRRAAITGVGCPMVPLGRVATSIAKAFPSATVVGLDPDRELIREARDAADAAGLGRSITFIAGSTQDYRPEEPFDLVTAFDCVHDFAEPVNTNPLIE